MWERRREKDVGEEEGEGCERGGGRRMWERRRGRMWERGKDVGEEEGEGYGRGGGGRMWERRRWKDVGEEEGEGCGRGGGGKDVGEEGGIALSS